ncbi:hypothetical protein TGAM01_v206610 [Trichoderma gamsii]|uniref:Uncharacterized protein n=1 Tax=Trichoderma gamsii TaxID=398673 RepID=A0A2P4ZK51_9HYPO|nr:hypothetical protein TGAM01_v206610 [Trichoderma gamsii]PON24680.1 hypothetical protein TGAM01_v206610 [Trichoderma gamsii]
MVTTVATTIREAISSSFTVPSTQLMTVQVPGTIIDPSEFCWNETIDSIKPLGVRIAEAQLVDNQIPISKVMIHRTGKSVSRSYLAALDCLVSVKTSVSSSEDDRMLTGRQSEIRDRYTQAMNYLTTSDDSESGKSRLQTYVEKQESWNQAVERYNEAQMRHLQTIKEKGLTAEQQEYSFLEWLQLNGRDYKAAIQAKYMDWVVYGHKFPVEFNFGLVDLASAMKRVESSKEAFRNLTLLAADGVTEYNSVNLLPSNWASLVQQKMDEWQKFKNSPSIIELHAEIKRLHHILISHQGLYDAISSGKFIPHQFSETENKASTTLRGHYEQAYADADAKKWAQEQISAKGVEQIMAEGAKILTGENKISAGKDSKPAVQKEDNVPSTLAGDIEHNVEAFINPFDAIIAEADTWNKAFTPRKAGVMQAVDDAGKEEAKSYVRNRIETITRQIEKLESKLKRVSSELVPLPNTIVVPEVYANGKIVDDHELIANRRLLEDSMVKDSSPWTRITMKVAVSEHDSLKAVSQSAMSENFGVGWGFWSMGIGESNSYPKDEPDSAMDDLEVEVSMDCMVVDIERPWLQAELFADHQLDAAPGFTISPGHEVLREAVEQDLPVEMSHAQFCSYPSAFIVASNVELEFHGNTAWLESSLEASAAEARASIGWGPFVLGSSSFKSSKSGSKSRIQSTETGVQVSLQTPQIIAWTQELLPALPKRTAGDLGLSELSLAEFSDIFAPASVLIEIWKAIELGAAGFSFEDDGRIAFDSKQDFRIRVDLVEAGGEYINQIYATVPYFGASLASKADLLRLRATTIVERQDDGDMTDFRWLLEEVARDGESLPTLTVKKIGDLLAVGAQIGVLDRLILAAIMGTHNEDAALRLLKLR